MSRQIGAWDVFYVWVEQVADEGKFKYVVVVGQVGSRVGILFINTDMTPNENLAVCDVRILQEHHSFLKHESYVTVSGLNATGGLCYLPDTAFTEEARMGVIAAHYRAPVIYAVHSCPTLTRKTLNFIVQCLDKGQD